MSDVTDAPTDAPDDRSTSPSKRTSDEDRQIMAVAGRAADRSPSRFGGIGVPTEKSDDFGATVRRLGRLLGRERIRVAVVVALTVASVVLVVLGPRLLGQATDIIVRGVLGGGIDFGRLHRKLAVIAALYLASWALSYAQAYILAGVVQRSMHTLRRAVEDKLNRLPLSYIDSQPRGDLLSRVTNDIDNLAQSLQQTVSMILQSILMLVGVAAMMIWISPFMAFLALVTVPPSMWLMKTIGGKARPRYMSQWAHTGDLNAQVEEVFTGHSVVKAFGRRHDAEERFRADNEELFRASFGAQFIASLIQPVMVVMGNAQYILIAVVGGLRISSGAISVGDMQALIQYARQFSQPLTQLASMATVFQSGVASLERVLELLDADEESAEPPVDPDPPAVRGRVVFDRVTFSYDPTVPLIEELSVVAEPGQTVAIVGPTGAGKTTLVNLIMRFYELDGGTITLDGRDIAGLRRDELRSKVGMVLQDTWLFGGSILDNIGYGNPEAGEAEIRAAAEASYVDRFVRHLPEGYGTVINDEGDNISVGQRQLITIARAFVADPSILILDEATSSVDTRTEVLIQKAMNRLREGRTSFVIAHRLSTIRGADVILVMERGRIVEQGSHAELLARQGAYHRLYNSQFEGAAVADPSPEV
ncbi:MAG: ABC transporter ATP-binding protein [Acidimicrobiales bacterium]